MQIEHLEWNGVAGNASQKVISLKKKPNNPEWTYPLILYSAIN